MNKEELMKKVVGKGRGRKTTMVFPIELRICKCHGGKNDQVGLWIRDNVNHFADQDRWSVAYDEELRLLYFFYGIPDIPAYKVQATKSGSHYIKFSNDAIYEIVKNNNKSIYAFYALDSDCGAYYVQL